MKEQGGSITEAARKLFGLDIRGPQIAQLGRMIEDGEATLVYKCSSTLQAWELEYLGRRMIVARNSRIRRVVGLYPPLGPGQTFRQLQAKNGRNGKLTPYYLKGERRTKKP